jgi:hypothetical protein
MSKSIYTHHYVYRITNVLLNKHYYGSRSCKNCNPHDDLGIKYFSSSKDKDFKKDQIEHPENYRYKIIKICETRKDAYVLEILLHEKFDVGINENFYNRCKATSSKFYYDRTGKQLSEEHRKKIGEANKGKKRSEEDKKKNSEAKKGEKHPFYGKHFSEEHRKKLSDAQKGENGYWYGKYFSEEHRKKMSESRKGEKNHRYGKNLSEETKMKLSEALKGEKHHKFKGYYVTPFGKFTSALDEQIKENNISFPALIRWCKTNNIKIISKKSYVRSKYLRENFDESIIGKTFADIGFSFETI